MKLFLRVLNRLDDIVGGAMMVVVVLVTFLGVVFRFVLNDPIPWTIELATVAFVWLTFVGASSAMRDELHIGIDVFTRLTPVRVQAAIGIVINLLMIWLMWHFVVGGWAFAWSAWLKITPVLHWPYTWVDLAVPFGGTMIALRLVVDTVKRMQRLIQGAPSSTSEAGESYSA